MPAKSGLHSFNHAIGGFDVFGYHLVNVLLHAATSALFVAAARKMLIQPSEHLLALVGLLFALHPIHTEAVSGLVGRAEVLAGLFFLASFLCYVKAVEQKAAKWVMASLAFVGLATLSKEQGSAGSLLSLTWPGVTIVAVNAAYDLFIYTGMDFRDWLKYFGYLKPPKSSPVLK